VVTSRSGHFYSTETAIVLIE